MLMLTIVAERSAIVLIKLVAAILFGYSTIEQMMKMKKDPGWCLFWQSLLVMILLLLLLPLLLFGCSATYYFAPE